MRIHRRIRNLTEPERKQFDEYLDKKLGALTPIIEAHHPDPDAVHVFTKIEKHDKHSAFAYECVLELPRKRLMSSEVKHSITEALDFANDKLEQRMVKHFKKLTKA